jgi:hypothetical protein
LASSLSDIAHLRINSFTHLRFKLNESRIISDSLTKASKNQLNNTASLFYLKVPAAIIDHITKKKKRGNTRQKPPGLTRRQKEKTKRSPPTRPKNPPNNLTD